MNCYISNILHFKIQSCQMQLQLTVVMELLGLNCTVTEQKHNRYFRNCSVCLFCFY